MRDDEQKRLGFIDLFRGILMVHMALDHSSMYFNEGRWAHEFAWHRPVEPADLWQFFTRFSGVMVAPAFCFIAGWMVAFIDSRKSPSNAGVRHVTRRLLVRGLVLLGFDYLLISLPEPGFFFLFAILSCLGVCLILLAALRLMPKVVLLLLGFGILAFHPALQIPWLPDRLQMLIYRAGFQDGFGVIYPVLPWLGIMILGYASGAFFSTIRNPAKKWLTLSALLFVGFFAIRIWGGEYGNAYPHHGIRSLDFWILAKYPPDLAWLFWSFWQIFFLLAVCHRLEGGWIFRLLWPLRVFGRCPFFFFILHSAVLLGASFVFPKGSLLYSYGIWCVLLLSVFFPCLWYSKMKLERPNFVTRVI